MHSNWKNTGHCTSDKAATFHNAVTMFLFNSAVLDVNRHDCLLCILNTISYSIIKQSRSTALEVHMPGG